MSKRIAVIGGGAAGMMAAIAAGRRGMEVLLLERNEKPGKKLFITGKGRCNLCNDCAPEDFFRNVIVNPKFLMSAVYGLTPEMLMELFAQQGLRLKTERGGRVFPQSDRSADVLRTLEKMLREAKVQVRLNARVQSVTRTEPGYFVLVMEDGSEVRADAVIVTTGGKSYPATGSTGDGYTIAQAFGHTVKPPYAALIPLEDARRVCPKMQGLTLKNVKLTLAQGGKKLFADQGELLFTHFGISGPLALTASCYIKQDSAEPVRVMIDLKPALDRETLDARLQREFEAAPNKQIKNIMPELLPSKMIGVFLDACGIDGELPANQLRKEQRRAMVETFKGFEVLIAGVRPIEEAIITGGGVAVREIDPSTMQSKLVTGLYFAGEVLDVHAKTGGFNLQIAFSTGYLAGSSAE